MATIEVTPEKLRETIEQMEQWLEKLRLARKSMEEFLPGGFTYMKAPPVTIYLEALIEFTAYVGGQTEIGRSEKIWGVTAKTKRRKKASKK